MAVVNPIYILKHAPVDAIGTILEITNGGTNTILTHEEIQTSSALIGTYDKNYFQWGGNIYIPSGSARSSAQGWIKFNPRTSKFHFWGYTSPNGVRFVPIGDRVGRFYRDFWNSGPSLEFVDHIGSFSVAANKTTWAVMDDIYYYCNGAGINGAWAYPFTSAPSQFGGVAQGYHLAAHASFMYMLQESTGTSWLKRLDGATWTSLGSGFAPTSASDLNAGTSRTAFFEWDERLWAVFTYNFGAAQMVRCYELNVSTGGATERNTYVPTAWKAAPPGSSVNIFEIIDDTSGSSRKVYLCRHNSTLGGFEIYEFNGDVGAWDHVYTNPGDAIIPNGIVWDRSTGQSGTVVGFTDSSPSSHAVLDLKVSDIINNDDVDLDIRYKDLTSQDTQFTPYDACTGYGGSSPDGKTSAPSAPSLAGLSDDFEDDVIDDDLWERVNPSINWANEDMGVGYSTSEFIYPLSEASGRIAFSSTAGSVDPAGYVGVGIRSKWCMQGAFQVDVEAAGLANMISGGASATYAAVFMIKSSTNHGYGFRVWNNVGTYYAEGFFCKEDTAPVFSGTQVVIIEGDVLRMERDGADAWTLTVDPDGSPTDTTPTGDDYPEDMQTWLFSYQGSGSNIATGDPGPGFRDIDVSGAGSVGKWEGGHGYAQSFDWDHVTDLGTGFNGGVQFWTRLA